MITHSFALCLAAWFTVAWLPARAAEPPLVFEKTIPLHGVGGRIDHMAIDLPRKRLIVAELGNNTVDLVDLSTGSAEHRIAGLSEPQGVGYAERADIILIANAGDGSVRLIDAKNLSPMGNVPLGDDADNVRIDPRNGLAVVGYGSGALALIDPAAHAKVGDIRLPVAGRVRPCARAIAQCCLLTRTRHRIGKHALNPAAGPAVLPTR